jgi:hypothetical protein
MIGGHSFQNSKIGCILFREDAAAFAYLFTPVEYPVDPVEYPVDPVDPVLLVLGENYLNSNYFSFPFDQPTLTYKKLCRLQHPSNHSIPSTIYPPMSQVPRDDESSKVSQMHLSVPHTSASSITSIAMLL